MDIPEICFPESASRLLENYFFGSTQKTSSRAKSLQNLWNDLAVERGQAKTKHYSFDKQKVETYASYYLPINFSKVPVILEEIKKFDVPLVDLLFKDSEDCRWIDFGCGPGTLFWGLLFSQVQTKIDFRGIDRSKNFTDIAEKLSHLLMQDQKTFGKVSASWKILLSSDEFLREIESFKPQVLSWMNSLGEVFTKTSEKTDFFSKLFSVLPKEKQTWFLLIEPALKLSTRDLLEFRKWLITQPHVQVYLPCLDNRHCGAFEDPNDWCHEEHAIQFPKWVNDLGDGAGMKKESLLFSYLIFSYGKSSREFCYGNSARLVSQRMLEKGMTSCFACVPGGKRKVRVLNSRTTPDNEIIHQCIRGQVFSEFELSEKNDVVKAK